MSEKLLEVFFRYKLVVAIPFVALILAGVVGTWYRYSSTSTEWLPGAPILERLLKQPSLYSANANIWVQRSTFLTSRLGNEYNPWLSPAQNHAQVLNDLLRLDSFATAVAARNRQLAALEPKLQVRAIREFTYVVPTGVNVLTVTHQDRDPQLARDIVQSIIDQYSATVRSEVIEQADTVLSFYEERLKETRDALERSKAELTSYLNLLPPDQRPVLTESLQLLPTDETATATLSDLKLVELVREARRFQEDYDTARSRLEEISQERDAALTGKNLSFRVMDPPQLPENPLRPPMRELLLLPALSLLLGASASAAVLFALARLDDNLRFPQDAQALGLTVLAVIPELGRRKRRSWPKHFVRLVVGAHHGIGRHMN